MNRVAAVDDSCTIEEAEPLSEHKLERVLKGVELRHLLQGYWEFRSHASDDPHQSPIVTSDGLHIYSYDRMTGRRLFDAIVYEMGKRKIHITPWGDTGLRQMLEGQKDSELIEAYQQLQPYAHMSKGHPIEYLSITSKIGVPADEVLPSQLFWAINDVLRERDPEKYTNAYFTDLLIPQPDPTIALHVVRKAEELSEALTPLTPDTLAANFAALAAAQQQHTDVAGVSLITPQGVVMCPDITPIQAMQAIQDVLKTLSPEVYTLTYFNDLENRVATIARGGSMVVSGGDREIANTSQQCSTARELV